jgi:hypothetical protein
MKGNGTYIINEYSTTFCRHYYQNEWFSSMIKIINKTLILYLNISLSSYVKEMISNIYQLTIKEEIIFHQNNYFWFIQEFFTKLTYWNIWMNKQLFLHFKLLKLNNFFINYSIFQFFGEIKIINSILLIYFEIFVI